MKLLSSMKKLRKMIAPKRKRATRSSWSPAAVRRGQRSIYLDIYATRAAGSSELLFSVLLELSPTGKLNSASIQNLINQKLCSFKEQGNDEFHSLKLEPGERHKFSLRTMSRSLCQISSQGLAPGIPSSLFSTSPTASKISEPSERSLPRSSPTPESMGLWAEKARPRPTSSS